MSNKVESKFLSFTYTCDGCNKGFKESEIFTDENYTIFSCKDCLEKLGFENTNEK